MKTFCYVCGLIEDINYPQGDITNHTISFLRVCGSAAAARATHEKYTRKM